MKTIIEMAREAGFNTNHEMIWINRWEVSPYMQRFAELVRADERKRFRVEDLEMLLTIRAEQIVGLQDEIRNLTGEE